MDYHNNSWRGCLANNVATLAYQMDQSLCLGCNRNSKSLLLHSCQNKTLLEKMAKHFEAVRLNILRGIENHFEYFYPKLTSTDKEKDKKLYLMSAEYFLTRTSPEFIFYGSYVVEELDDWIQ